MFAAKVRPALFSPGGYNSLAVAPESIQRAGIEIGNLNQALDTVQQTLGHSVTALRGNGLLGGHGLFGIYPWGGLGMPIRPLALRALDDLDKNIRSMKTAFTDSTDQLKSCAMSYMDADQIYACTIEGFNEKLHGHKVEVRDLNLASQFYKNNETLYLTVTHLPGPFGNLGNLGVDILRLYSNLTSGDPFNVGMDIKNIVQDIWGFCQAYLNYVANSKKGGWFGESLDLLAPFLAHFWKGSKLLANFFTGDTKVLGQEAYNLDSLAKALHRIAEDFRGILRGPLGLQRWSGAAADTAREYFGSILEGISATARQADHAAALLQLAAWLMYLAEWVVRAIIGDFLRHAVHAFLISQLLVVGTGGTAQLVAARKVARDAEVATAKIGTILTVTGGFMARMAHIWWKLMRAFRESSVGQTYLHRQGRGGQELAHIRSNLGLGRHGKPVGFGQWGRHVWLQLKRDVKNRSLFEFGLAKFPEDRKGNKYASKDGKTAERIDFRRAVHPNMHRIRVTPVGSVGKASNGFMMRPARPLIRDGAQHSNARAILVAKRIESEMRETIMHMMRDYVGFPLAVLGTVLPGLRALQYALRANDGYSAKETDALFATPLPQQ